MVIVEMTESEAKRFLETTKVKVTPEESEQIQKFAFRLGYEWEGCGKKVVNAAYPYLYFDVKRLAKGLKKHRITCGFDESVFENSHKDELRPNDIFSVKISYPFDIVL